MMTLVTGGSKCGKSSYAENLLESFEGTKIYLATMMPYGEEAHAAVERHRRMREKKNFTTIEKYTDIHEAEIPEGAAVLLECMGNLCANEMFSDGEVCDPSGKITDGIRYINERASELVVVTNTVGCDGIAYSPETEKYIEVMAEINARAAAMADRVTECVYGIPVIHKGQK